jgi:multidrug efflux pump subunit AcrA (membrane-fusion protein)
VWVVGSDNTVAFRPVVVGAKFGDHWIVEEGLKAGEMVVTAGGQRLRSDVRVMVDNKSAQQ